MLFACITEENLRTLSQEEVARMRLKEKDYYRKLVTLKKLRSYHVQAGSRGNVLLFDVDSAEEMHRLLMLGPLAMFQNTSVYPLMTLPQLGDLPEEME
ncbi:MAG: muconolactone Delta-isomerase family protein [Spirochaetales bacterium]|nr:muconolactone Delta-isomerase family protein [Spirochaetales bacterium]